MSRRPRSRTPGTLVVAGAAALVLLTGCSEGADAFNENLPDGQAEAPQQRVVRTPGPISSDLPYETPPLVVPLPGPTGGTPGVVRTDGAQAGPGGGEAAPDSDR